MDPSRPMPRDPFATALNAMSNASRQPAGRAEVVDILARGDGPGSLVRALFGDCSFETLERLGIAAGVPRTQILAAYANARRLHAAANAELDDFVTSGP